MPTWRRCFAGDQNHWHKEQFTASQDFTDAYWEPSVLAQAMNLIYRCSRLIACGKVDGVNECPPRCENRPLLCLLPE